MTTRKRAKVFVVMLRQPRRGDFSEMRTDPFWEFGSFGLTGCHQRNLLHPKRAGELSGARLAFVQGGDAASRLVFLTPPVKAIPYADRTEVRWEPAPPFRYEKAPTIVAADGGTDMPAFKAMIEGVRRNGWMGKFASKFRTQCNQLPPEAAAEVIAVYERRRKAAFKGVGEGVTPPAMAHCYTEALPYPPLKTDNQRAQTYKRLLERAEAGGDD
jgi:hypothetical protein